MSYNLLYRLVLTMNRLTQIRQLPCCQCHAPPPSQACHANWGEFGKGMGIKADDSYTIPLCATCHREFDTYVWQTRQQAKVWFIRKLEFVNRVIDEKENPTEPMF